VRCRTVGFLVRHMSTATYGAVNQYQTTATIALEHARGEIRKAGPDIRDEGQPQQDVEPGVEDLVETGQADGCDEEEMVRPSAHQRPHDVCQQRLLSVLVKSDFNNIVNKIDNPYVDSRQTFC